MLTHRDNAQCAFGADEQLLQVGAHVVLAQRVQHVQHLCHAPTTAALERAGQTHSVGRAVTQGTYGAVREHYLKAENGAV